MRMQRQPVISEKDSDENENSQLSSMDIRIKKNVKASNFVRSSQCLTLRLNAVVRSGFFKQFQTLSVFYTITSGSNWKRVSGQQSGISQMSYSPEGQIVWNFPIEAIYETDYLADPPQIVFIFYGHDFFGRTIPKAYGNVHFPISEGNVTKTVRTFRVCQSSIWSQMYSFMTGSYYEFKQIEKVLTNSQQRANLRMKTSGKVEVEFNVKRYNFQKYGYDE